MRLFSSSIFWIISALCWTSHISSAMALLMGLILSFSLGNPYPKHTVNLSKKLLPLSVIGLGAGVDLYIVSKAGIQGIQSTLITIGLTLLMGLLLGHLFKVDRILSLLISVGTAICGGSAIAALSPTINADNEKISTSLAVVFFLNSIALFLFPMVGHFFGLSQEQFGLWSALAIHDTSSVVGATMAFGSKALHIGTTIKLARSLWIVPVTWFIGLYYSYFIQKKDASTKVKIKYPWFILGFLFMSALVTWAPSFSNIGHFIFLCSKNSLIFTLFLIGLNISKKNIQRMGYSSLLLAVSLWVIVASLTLYVIYKHPKFI